MSEPTPALSRPARPALFVLVRNTNVFIQRGTPGPPTRAIAPARTFRPWLPPCFPPCFSSHVIRLVVPAQSARPGPPLSPALGQHAVKVADFVAEFNRASAGFTPGVPLRVRLAKLPANKFTLDVRGVSTHAVLRGTAPVGGRVRRTALYDAAVAAGRTTPSGVRTFLGSLRSTRWVPE